MENRLTVDTLINELNLLQHLEVVKKQVTSRICLDEITVFSEDEWTSIEIELNETYTDYTFEVVPVFSGFAIDLLITNKTAKKQYDSIPKTKTYKDVYRILYEEYGIHSSGTFTTGLNEKITDKEFDSLLNFHISLSKMTAEAFKK